MNYLPREHCRACKKTVPALFVIWCPTWTDAHTGPTGFCEEHGRNFQVKYNNNAKDGQFFFGDDAIEAFNSVEDFITKDDPRFLNALGMLNNHRQNKSLTFSEVVVVDGKVWIVNASLITRLGNYSDVKERMPNLFK